jgi:hypothetical protein
MTGGRFRWDDDTLSPALRVFAERIDGMIATATEFKTSRAEEYAKSNAPWTDQTSNARNGIGAVAEHSPGKRHSIVVYHSVNYGIWLEVRHAGRNAILMPTAIVVGRELMDMIGRNWGPAVRGSE